MAIRASSLREGGFTAATTGIAATAIFCLIFAWNEYAFAVLLTSGNAQTAPPFIPIIIGEVVRTGLQSLPYNAVPVPIVVFTVLLRKLSCAHTSERFAMNTTDYV